MADLVPFANDGKPDTDPTDEGSQRDINTQLAFSVALGLAAFLTFCVCTSVLRRYSHQLTKLNRFYVLAGRVSTLHGNDKSMRRLISQSCQTASSDGYLSCIGYPRRKYSHLLALMPSW